ncbi:DUF2845 domain-containing protein [Comamonas sp. JC664]|uniref:DUF2845 domain-containing protein n=1 Tax=Comamonas sp. JC664 TaxID=2801917 RepID=UPI00191F836F|nr:DUF2845 domain-containing protein [Comamonas sp. JC664]MBL0694998.1 DUF2845 domain-containing protein [Comamonas sp. JC664]GHH02564.1 hypothetical protein GCM10012319_70950 [Comamonas sp. KCTC 72670]
MRTLGLTLALAMAGAPLAAEAASLRCGQALVADGALKAEVLAKCGEPAAKDFRTVTDSAGSVTPDHRTGGVTTERRSVTREYEDWTYNFGPRRFLQVVTFENGRLIDVQSAGYGS